MRPLNTWLPQTTGTPGRRHRVAILITAPPGTSLSLARASGQIRHRHSADVPRLRRRDVSHLRRAVSRARPGSGHPPNLSHRRRKWLPAPLVILLQQRSLWATVAAAFIVWTLSPTHVNPKPQWKKFAGSFLAAVLLQLGIASALGEESRLSALALGIAAAPILWRIRQERDIRGPFGPKPTLAIALLLAIFGLTAYLPMQFGGSAEAASGDRAAGSKTNPTSPGVSVGGKYRGVVLIPEEEEHTILVPPIPFMGRDPFQAHKDPIGIPFYGVYWFFQFPDKGPNEDAYRVKGSPDNVTFRSAVTGCRSKCEAHQNLGRLIDVSACSRIDIAIRNDDAFTGSLALELDHGKYHSLRPSSANARQRPGE